MHLRSIGFRTTASAVAGSLAAPAVGDVLTVENGKEGSAISIVDWFGFQNTNAGFQQLIYPSGHDTTQGIRSDIPGLGMTRFKPVNAPIPLQPQELLAFTIGGAATAGDVDLGIATIYYEELPGIQGHFITYEEFSARGTLLCGVEEVLTGVVTGDWSAGVPINNTADLLLANRDYAWLGGVSQVVMGGIAMSSPDFGNVRVACPGLAGVSDMGSDYFATLAYETGLPCIPVINSGNRANVLLSCLDNENTAPTSCSFTLALLAK